MLQLKFLINFCNNFIRVKYAYNESRKNAQYCESYYSYCKFNTFLGHYLMNYLRRMLISSTRFSSMLTKELRNKNLYLFVIDYKI